MILVILYFGLNRAYSLGSNELLQAVDTKDYELALKLIPEAINQNPKDAMVHYIAGDVYLEMEKYEDAVRMFKKTVDIDKKNIDAWIKLGRALTFNDKREEAMEVLKDAQDKDEKNVFILLEMANVYLSKETLNNEDLTKAELLITQARELNKKEPASFVALGDYYFKQRVYDLAKQNYDEALQLNENLTSAREKLAISLYWLGNRETDEELSSQYFKRSLEEWNKLTQQDPKNAKAFFEQGKILFLSKNYKDAVISLRNFINLRPSSSLGRWYLAQSLDDIGAFDTAAYHLEIVSREIDSVKNKALIMRARALYDASDQQSRKNTPNPDLYKQTISAYEKAEKDTALIVFDYQKIGQSYMLLKDTAKALDTWKKSVMIDSNESCRIMDQMGFIYQKIGKYQDAIDILSKRIQNANCKSSNDHIAYYFIGQSYLLLKMPESAIDPLQKSSIADSTFLFSKISLGDAYASLSKNSEAELTYNQVLDIGKSDTAKYSFALIQAFSKLGQMYLDQKKFNDVVKIGEKWASIFPSEAYAYLFQAIGYHNLQNGKMACQNYRKVLKIDPKNASAQKNLKSLSDANACGDSE